MKASDIKDHQMLQAVRRHATNIGASIWNIQADFPDFPHKVVRAKLHALLRRRLIVGCCCGCRGDFGLTERGDRVWAARSPEET